MYCTKTDIEQRMGTQNLVILCDDNMDGSADSSIVNSFIIQASSRINASISSRYTVPVNPVPSELVWLCVSLCVPLIFARNGEKLPEEHRAQQEAAIDFLSSLRNGEASVSGASSRILSESTTRNKSRLFKMDKLNEF
jgi:phage gp36-like protein